MRIHVRTHARTEPPHCSLLRADSRHVNLRVEDHVSVWIINRLLIKIIDNAFPRTGEIDLVVRTKTPRRREKSGESPGLRVTEYNVIMMISLIT